ncbi:breast cancer type 2 susceptibility protein isoform X2 [Toxotes jaculatrix]|uniref:breast cancer type 2 susceptibility protein isoform X2 n=1 Tax=Toxotes jaculatrix TaxID=941984 RepID=UPI001B3AEF8B|nr:breast cancer type 2 susceptibility protein isoform X2 [Toxotes jaculatrix]
MDLPLKNMYDAFKDEIWKELGPLDPDWFDVLTAQTLTTEGDVSDQEDLFANQEGNLKPPFDKPTLDSQLFSTPKVFRHSQVVSPETEDDHSFTAEQEKETLPWMTTQSPYLFRLSKGGVPEAKYEVIQPQSQDSFDLLHTIPKSPVSYAKQISESLGAQIHPDISWTSSLNTPPAVPSTLILSKTDESPCPVSVSADKDAIFVRKLFPSLSNVSRDEAASPKNSGMPNVHQGVVSPEAGQVPESHDLPQNSPNQSQSVWRQKLPDAIEDGELRSTVASVLDGAENVLSIFFTNSSSALRKVKTDRIKRKQSIQKKEHGCSSTDISTTNNTASGEQRTDDWEPVELSSPPPVKTGSAGITQWSPLNLSEIPPCIIDFSCHDNIRATQVENNILTEKLQSDSDCGQLPKPPLTIKDSGFTKKKRKFVYTVDTSKTQVQGKEKQFPKMDSSAGIPDSGYKKSQDETDCCSNRGNEIQKQENVTEETLHPSVQPKVQDLDMSQLCKDFAQDFSQMLETGKMCKIAEQTPQNGFSPSACLSAMKRAKQKTRQANLPQDCDGVSNRRHVSATNQNYSITEGTVSDSGFQSAVADITHLATPSFVLPSSEDIGQSQQCNGFKTDRTASFLCSNTGNGKYHLDDILQEAETDAKLPRAIKQSHTHLEKTTLPLPYVHASGFKTASNKGIRISSANLERAKHLFEEDEAQRTFRDQPTKRAHDTKDGISLSNGSVKNTVSNSNQPPSSSENISCQLTASQKADVTELCTLLEEADSQFEFTQFKTATLQQPCQDNATSPQKPDKELDPDFLMGIDFDDSFSSDAEKHLATTVMTSASDGKTNCETAMITGKSTVISFSSEMKKENPSTEDVSSSSKHISEGSSSIISTEPRNLGRAGHTETSKEDSKDLLMLGVGFKTAGGNVLRVSEKCLSKARALFADLEENLTDQKSQDKQSSEVEAKTEQRQVTSIRDKDAAKSFNNGKTDTTTCQSGFQMASGKGISVSAKAEQEANAFFKDCDISDSNTGMSVKREKSIEPFPTSVSHKKSVSKFKNVQRVKQNFSEEPISEFEKVYSGPAACHTEVVRHNVEIQRVGFKNTQALTNAVPTWSGSLPSNVLSSPSCTTSKNTASSAVNEVSNGGGFCTASGKNVCVSAAAMKKAECLLNEIHMLEDTNKQLKQKGDSSRTGHLTNESQVAPLKNCGFQTASGKGLVISSAALKKAKSLLSECEAVEDNISVKPTHSKMPVPGLSSSNRGFLAASGKPMALSTEALQKANAFFSDITCSAEIPAGSDTRNRDKKQDNAGNSGKIHCGFRTAGGATVCVSQKNLLKATNILKEFDDGSVSSKTKPEADAFLSDCDLMDSNNGMSVKHVAHVTGSDSEKRHLSKFTQDLKVINTSEQRESGHSEFENLNMGPVVHHENLLHPDDGEIQKGVFRNTPNSNGNSSLMAKPLSSPLCTTSENTGVSTSNEFSNSVGFSTASGKKVTVSDEAITKAKSLLNESASFLDANKQLKQKDDSLPPQKGVVSSAAPKKAKTLLNECDGVEDKISVKPTHTKMPLSCSPPGNGGFLAASGKPVAFSSEALQKAKALFSDITLSAEIPAVSDSKKSDKYKDRQSNTEGIHCGFRTAGGAKVHMSQKNLLKAKKLLKEFESHDLNSSSTIPHDIHKSELSKMEDVKRTSNCDLTTFKDMDMSAQESACQVLKSFQALQETDLEKETLQNSSVHGCISVKEKAPTDTSEFKEGRITPSWVGNLHDTHRKEMANVLCYEVNHTISTEENKLKGTEESSVLILQSLNLSDCTETQQKFLAQEALDCTKALLEDEGRAGQRLSVTLENVPQQDNPKSNNRSVEEQKGRGKRSLDNSDITGQPPLKRRLLEEFDRTVDGSRGSTLQPQKSCPTNVMKDRRAFNYSVSPHPNITRPHGNGKNYVETRLQKTTPAQCLTSLDSRSAHSKMPAFVPPFIKNSKTETHKNTVLKDNMKAPSTFVPPFKKQRTIVQVSSTKPQEEEDKHHHLFVKPSNSDAYVPPTKETQICTDVTDNKNKEDIQTVALTDSTNDHLMNKQNIPVGCQDVFQNLENVELARDMQDMRIRKKKRQTIRPLPGSLFLTKTSGVSRIPLKAAVNGKPPARYTQKQLYGYGVHQHVSGITSETAETFRFSLQQFLKLEAFTDGGGVQLADGGWLIPSNDGTAGKEEFYRALCDTPSVDPKLISEEWVYNHYRWIVWKQASMERSFPETLGSLCLTPEQVLLQLKYRYDVEIDRSRRPALRKIMERDDTAAKTLVLCVCGIVSRGHSPNRESRRTPQGLDAKVEHPSAVVWLTDGWYAIKAQLDEPLTAMLHKGRLSVGGKLIIYGAQLVGSQDACSPLEAPESLMLKICTNSCRPTRWDTKLGFHRDPRPFLLPVSSLYSNGGPVGCVDITILRSYPIQWMERKPDGGVVFRSVRAEEKEARRYSSHKQKAMEILFSKIQTEFEKQEKGNDKPQRRRRTISRQDIANLQDGEELHEAVGDDPAYLEAHLSEQQLETLQTYRRSLMEKKQAELQDRYRHALEAESEDGGCPKRDVTPVWRLCFADSMDQTGSVYQLNLWRPSSDLQSLLKEGCRYKVYNLTTSDGKRRSGIESIQLTGTKKTQFQDLQASQEWLSAHFQPRVSTNFVNLQNPEFQPLCGEVDLTGYIISVIDSQGSSPAFYLADGRLNFVKVRCFSSFSHSGLEDVVKPRVLLALSNLQLRGQSTSPTPVVYAGDLTVFSTNPKEVHLKESLCQLRNLVQSQENFFLTAEEKLSHLVKSNGLSSFSSPALQPQTPAFKMDTRQDTKTSVISQQPIRSLGYFTPVSRNPPVATSSTDKDPRSLKRRRALDYLSRIPSPPALSHLGSVASPCVKKTFNPPRRSGTPSTLKTVQTPARKPAASPMEDEWVNDEELAMIDTQKLRVGHLL